MENTENAITDDYGVTALGERIPSMLEAYGVDIDNLIQEILAEIDHIHGGGYLNAISHAEIPDRPLVAIKERRDIAPGGGGASGLQVLFPYSRTASRAAD